DPTSGRFGTTVPVGSVESIDVFKTPFLPQYGKFTAGVVAVQTRRGGDSWHYTLKEPFPDFRVRSGHIRGLRDATPKFNFSGTLHFTPQHTNFVDPQFFNQQPVTPSYRGFQGAWTFIDHINTSAGLLESSLSHQIFRARTGSQGNAEMVLMPTGNLGNYFAN